LRKGERKIGGRLLGRKGEKEKSWGPREEDFLFAKMIGREREKEFFHLERLGR
jgi:hypothetical protein